MELKKIGHTTKSFLRLGAEPMITTDMAFALYLSLVPEVCSSSPSCNYDSRTLITSHLKTLLATYKFAPIGMPDSFSTIITLQAWASLRKQQSSVSHFWIHIVRAGASDKYKAFKKEGNASKTNVLYALNYICLEAFPYCVRSVSLRCLKRFLMFLKAFPCVVWSVSFFVRSVSLFV